MTIRVAVLGGGIGGLTAAAGLRQAGWPVDVFERAPALPAVGTALGMWPSALRALDAIGVGDAVRRCGRRQTGGAFLRPDGSRIVEITVRGPEPVYLISRPALLRLIADAAGEVRFGIETELAELAEYDVVIAADGVRSRSRDELFGPGHRPRYAGVTAWRGTAAGDVGTVTETWGDGASFGITPQEGGRRNWFACVPAPPEWQAPGGELAALRARFGGWHGEVRSVLAELTEPDVLRHDLYQLGRPLPSFVKGNGALIGDAAHAMTPNLGRGACEALIDAVALTTALTSGEPVPEALAAYDTARRRPTQRMVRAAWLMSRLTHTRRLTRLRDVAVRFALTVGSPPD